LIVLRNKREIPIVRRLNTTKENIESIINKIKSSKVKKKTLKIS
jgi:hypothetical protein